MENVVRIIGIGGLIEVSTGGGGAFIYALAELYNNSYSR